MTAHIETSVALVQYNGLPEVASLSSDTTHTLSSLGISGHLLNWFKSYLSDRKQRVVVSSSSSSWSEISAGVPQGSILGPLLFLIYINDIVTDIEASIRLFTDDTNLYIVIEMPDASAAVINFDFQKIATWSSSWLQPIKNRVNEIFKETRQTYPSAFTYEQCSNRVCSFPHTYWTYFYRRR